MKFSKPVRIERAILIKTYPWFTVDLIIEIFFIIIGHINRFMIVKFNIFHRLRYFDYQYKLISSWKSFWIWACPSADSVSVALIMFLRSRMILRFKRTHPPTSWKFFRIGQITCSLKFLEEFYLLFHMQKESRRYQSKNYDPQVIRKFGEFLDFKNHILIWKQKYINNWFPNSSWVEYSHCPFKTSKIHE